MTKLSAPALSSSNDFLRSILPFVAVLMRAAAPLDVMLVNLTRPSLLSWVAIALENVFGGTWRVLLQAQASKERPRGGTPSSWLM